MYASAPARTCTVAMQLDEFVSDVERNVQECGPIGVAGHMQLLYRRQPVVRVRPKLQQQVTPVSTLPCRVRAVRCCGLLDGQTVLPSIASETMRMHVDRQGMSCCAPASGQTTAIAGHSLVPGLPGPPAL